LGFSQSRISKRDTFASLYPTNTTLPQAHQENYFPHLNKMIFKLPFFSKLVILRMSKECKAITQKGTPCTKNVYHDSEDGYCFIHHRNPPKSKPKSKCKAALLNGGQCPSSALTETGYCCTHMLLSSKVSTLQELLEKVKEYRNNSTCRQLQGEAKDLMHKYINERTPPISNGALQYQGVKVGYWTKLIYTDYEPLLEIEDHPTLICHENLVVPEDLKYRLTSDRVTYIWYTVKGFEDDYRNHIRIIKATKPSKMGLRPGYFYVSPLWFVKNPDWEAFGGPDCRIKTRKMVFEELQKKWEENGRCEYMYSCNCHKGKQCSTPAIPGSDYCQYHRPSPTVSVTFLPGDPPSIGFSISNPESSTK
jgi:hypothetical protein